MAEVVAPRSPGSVWSRVGRALGAVVLIGYPVLVWFGLTAWSPRVLALVLLCVLGPLVWYRLRRRAAGAIRGLVAIPLVTVVALLLAALLDRSGYVLLVPVAINTILLLLFGVSLRSGSIAMIERFARLSGAELSPRQQAWCRTWTWIWCAFFLVNGGTALVLALAAPLSWWTAYNGLIAYVLMGLLFAGEWLLRRRRFGPDRRSPS